MIKRLKAIGPGAMVAAAFIGPGTVLTATKAGGSFGYTLLWAVLFSTVACIVMQEMAARLGVVGRLGLGDAIRAKFTSPLPRALAIALVVGTILAGNAAYEAGNIAGASWGASIVVPSVQDWPVDPIVITVGVIAFVLLSLGRIKWIERVLIGLVCLMGLVFLFAAISVNPDWTKILAGLFIPRVPESKLMMVVGIIGTTVVPYNLFLHATAAQARWRSSEDLAEARLDTILSVSLGGVITAAILIAAAGASEFADGRDIQSAESLSLSLKGMLGNWAPIFLAFGFMAAGLSSAITAPLAASFATNEVLGWKEKLGDRRFSFVWIAILVIGVGVAAARQQNPQAVILYAQVANGVFLPVVAIFLVYVMNDAKLMGPRVNGWLTNALGGLVLLVTVMMAGRALLSVYHKISSKPAAQVSELVERSCHVASSQLTRLDPTYRCRPQRRTQETIEPGTRYHYGLALPVRLGNESKT